MNPAVQGYAAAVVDALGADERARAVADVAAVDRQLSRNADLRAALTDVAVPARARRSVLSELLEGKVSPAVQRLCAYATGAVRAQEVPGAITWLAHRLRQMHDTPEVEEQPLGHLAARERVGGYAAALFEDVSTGELEEVEDQLFRFARTVGATPELRGALGDRDLPAQVRRAVVDQLLSGRVHAATLRLVDYAVVGGRARDIVGTLDWLVEQTAAARGWRVARVRAGQQVSEEERGKLERTLGTLAGAPVELQVTVDPALLAGVNVRIGDIQLDETARGRLERFREHVRAGAWTDAGVPGRAPAGQAGHGARGGQDARGGQAGQDAQAGQGGQRTPAGERAQVHEHDDTGGTRS
ncbi:MAG: F0F1 ATP synthase subunit delta [Acidimicrobiales bacterium]